MDFLDIIGISKAHQLLIAFTTDSGVYAHNKMPFGLCNAPATYQRLVIIAFQEYLHKFIELFLDDFCVFSTKVNHADCLAKCFAKCHEYGISLNAAKLQFVVLYGKLLGHIVSAQGMALTLIKWLLLLICLFLILSQKLKDFWDTPDIIVDIFISTPLLLYP
jgi:hypothetical protein